MKAITIWQPWASAIVSGPKRIENRTWVPPRALFGQRIAIHAGKTLDRDASADLMDADGLEPQWLHDPNALPLGAIVGTAILAGVVRESSDPWFAGFGAVGWVLEDVRACEPIPCRGAQGLWEVPADIGGEARPMIPVVGIDPSLSGLAIATEGGGIVEMASKLRGKTPAARVRRYWALAERARAVLPERAALIVLEGYSYGSRGSVIQLAEFGGILRTVLYSVGPIVEVAPKTLKKFVTGNGGAEKSEMVDALMMQGIEVRSHNEADAFGLLQIGLCLLGRAEPETASQRAVLHLLKDRIPSAGAHPHDSKPDARSEPEAADTAQAGAKPASKGAR